MTPSPCWDADGDTILVAPPPSQATDTGGGCSSARRMLATVHGGEHAPAAEMGETGRGDRIRTCDILLPKQARYRAALLPEPPMPLGFMRSGNKRKERPGSGELRHAPESCDIRSAAAAAIDLAAEQISRAHVCTPVTNAHLVCGTR